MSKTPIVRPVSWLNASVNIGLLMVFAVVGAMLWYPAGAAAGAAIYLLLSINLRRILGQYHRRGIACTQRQAFEEAIPEFQRSLDFFEKYPWVDKYRAVTMLSAAAMSYREMALVSLAFCYGQLGDGPRGQRLLRTGAAGVS